MGIRFVAPGAAKNVYEIKTIYKPFKGVPTAVLLRIKDKKITEIPLESVERMQRNHVLVVP